MLPHAYRELEGLISVVISMETASSSNLRRSPLGLRTRGGKDWSLECNLHRDGEVAKPPIALCEVQGYVYDARYAWPR